MITLKTNFNEKVKLDDISFEIRPLTREEFLYYSKRISELSSNSDDSINPEFMDLTLEIIEKCIVVNDEKIKDAVVEKIASAPIAIQNKLFERIMSLSTVGK